MVEAELNSTLNLGDKEFWDAITLILRQLRTVLTNLRIYPPGSKMAEKSALEFAEMFTGYLNKYKDCILMENQDLLMINGLTLPDNDTIKSLAKDIAHTLNAHNVRSITFKDKVTPQELSLVLEHLAKRGKNITVQNLTKIITDFKIEHIAIDEVTFAPIRKGQEVHDKVVELVKRPVGDVTSAMLVLHDFYETVSEIPEKLQQEDLKNQLLDQFAKLDVQVLREIIGHELPPKIESSGFRQQLLDTLSREKIEEIFFQIGHWYEELKEKANSDLSVVEQLESLKRFISKILTAPASRKVPFDFYEQLLRVGLINEVPTWVEKPVENKSLVYQVDLLLEKDSLCLLESPTYDSLPDLIRKLCQSELDDLAQKLVLKLTDNFKISSGLVRLNTAKVVKEIVGSLNQERKEKILIYLQEIIKQTITRETDVNIYAILAEILVNRLPLLILDNEYNVALNIISLFKKHSQNLEDSTMKNIAAVATQSLNSVCQLVTEILVADIRSSDITRQQNALNLAGYMAENLVLPIFNFVRQTEDLRLRKLVIKIFTGCMPQVRTQIVNLIKQGLSVEEFTRVIELFPDLVDETTLTSLPEIINYPDANVRRLVCKVLAKLDLPVAKKYLVDMINDLDEMVRKEAIRYLGELKYTPAVNLLLTKLTRDTLSVREQICLTLGMLGDYQSVFFLVPIARGTLLDNIFAKDRNVRLRTYAIWSLARIPCRETEETIRKLMHNRNPIIAKAAEQSWQVLTHREK